MAELKKEDFWSRIITDSHELIITIGIFAIFFGFLGCLTAMVYQILTDSKVDSELIAVFKEYDDLVKMVLTYMFTRWSVTKNDKKGTNEGGA